MDMTLVLALTIIFMIYGLGMITGGPSTATRWSHWVYQNVVLRPIRWGWYWIWFALRWLGRVSRGQVVRGIRAGVPTWNHVIIICMTLVITAVVMWLIMRMGSLVDTLGSIEFGLPENWNLFYIALTVLTLGVIFWLGRLWLSRPRGTAVVAPVGATVYQRRGLGLAGGTFLVILGMAAGIGVIYWYLSQSNGVGPRIPFQTQVATRLPADVVLPIIAQCESGGRQFEDNGVTPLKNKEGSSGFGKYQFLESHRETATAMGFDLDTESGQDDYARIVLADPAQGLKPWEKSRWCWEKDLLARGYLQYASLSNITRKVTVGREWTEPIRFPMGRRVDWMPESAVTYEIMTADEKTITFPAVTQAPIKVESLLHPWFKFRVVDADSVVINVVAYVPR